MGWLKRLFNKPLDSSVIKLGPDERLIIWLTLRDGYEEGEAELMTEGVYQSLSRIGIKGDRVRIFTTSGYESPDFVKEHRQKGSLRG